MAPPPATGAGFVDPAANGARWRGGGRTLFFERVGLGDGATVSTDALRWYVEPVGGDPD